MCVLACYHKFERLCVFNLKQVINSFVYIVSDVLVKALPFFLIPIITRYLTVEEYGEVALAQTFIEVCTIILVFGSHHFYRYEFFNGKIHKEVLLFVPILIALFNFIFVFVASFVYISVEGGSKSWYLFIPLAAFSQSVISLIICKFQTVEKPIFVGITNFSQATTAFVFTILLLNLGFGIDGRLSVVIFTPVFIGGIVLCLILRKVEVKHIKASFKLFKTGFKFGAKAFPSSISWWLRSGMDRVLLQYMVGVGAVGVFSIAAQFTLVITVISGAINNAIMPSLFRSVNENNYSSAFRLIAAAVAVVSIISFGLILVSPILINYVLPAEYKSVADYFTPLIIGSIFHSVFLFASNLLVADKMIAKLSTISILSSLSHLVISIFMIKYYAMHGLVWSGVISYGGAIIVLISVYFYNRRTL